MRISLSRTFSTSLSITLITALAWLAPLSGHAAGVRMVTTDTTGSAAAQANSGGSLEHRVPSMSGDAAKVVFSSIADNLTSIVPDNDDENGDPNNVFDVFLWTNGSNALVGENIAGSSSGDGAGIDVAISRNGQHVAFVNDSTNLAIDEPNPMPTPTPDGDDHLYLLSGGQVNFLTLDFTGDNPANGIPGVEELQVGNNGKVFFTWSGFTLIDDEVICDRNGSPDLFVYDSGSGNPNKIDLLSISQNPDFSDMLCDPGATDKTGNGGISDLKVDESGTRILFISSANDLISPQIEADNDFDSDLFLWDNGTIKMITVNATGDDGGNAQPENASISADGLTVVFESMATDLVSGISDTGSSTDVFVWNEGLGVRLVSVDETGLSTGNGNSFNASVSGNGLLVTFESNASDLVATDNRFNTQIYLRSILANTTEMISLKAAVSTAATPSPEPIGASGGSFDSFISKDGSTVAFRSTSDELTGATITESVTQIYVRDLAMAVNQLLTPGTTGGGGGNGASIPLDISSDGRYVLFTSAATNLVEGVSDSGITADDIFIAEQLGFVEFDEAEYEVTEGDSGTVQVTVTVNRLKAGDSAASVGYKTDDASPDTTATAGVDYATKAGTLDWGPGETGAKNFTIDVTGDEEAEADEFIKLVLENPTGTGIGNQSSTRIKIVNDDENCSNGTNDDPDEDTDVDCDDSECTDDPACTEICDDNNDNDGDGDVDCDDSDCAAEPTCLTPEVCNNGADDDDDTLVDCLDTTDCSADPACTDPSGDGDSDGVLNATDNCPSVSNPGQEDTDGDGLGNACDTTEGDCNNNQNDDIDGLSDCADPDCAASNDCVDGDGDGVANSEDNCPAVSNPGQEDTDSDGTGNACDTVEGSCNNGQSDDTDALVDCLDTTDCSADPACAAPTDDDDLDGVLNATDNCPSVSNPLQEDTDADGIGNACDTTENDCDNGVTDDLDSDVDCSDANCALAPNCVDDDSDGVPNITDNCDNVANPLQEDTDGDGLGNACDTVEGSCNNGVSDDNDALIDCLDVADCGADPVCAAPGDDDDGDGVLNGVDNCPSVANADQANTDGDSFGNACDATEGDCDNGVSDDTDADVDCDDSQCSAAPNCGDTDGDGALNGVDNCPAVSNPGQENADGDSLGDACDPEAGNCANGDDDDGDGDADCDDADCSADPACVVPPENCTNGGDDDGDLLADCDDPDCGSEPSCSPASDDDGDGVANGTDNCPGTSNADQADADGDGIGDACDSTPGGDDGNGGNGGDGDSDGDGDGNGGGGAGAFPPGTSPRGGGGFCQLRPEAVGGSMPWTYLLGLGGLGVWRLRRKG